MNKTIVDARSSVIAFSIDPEVTRAIDHLADVELLTRSAWVRRVVINHLREQGHLPSAAPVTRAARRREAA